jgi:hypothetical protein
MKSILQLKAFVAILLLVSCQPSTATWKIENRSGRNAVFFTRRHGEHPLRDGEVTTIRFEELKVPKVPRTNLDTLAPRRFFILDKGLVHVFTNPIPPRGLNRHKFRLDEDFNLLLVYRSRDSGSVVFSKEGVGLIQDRTWMKMGLKKIEPIHDLTGW